MRSVATVGSFKNHKFLSLNDYEKIMVDICDKEGWEYVTFRDYIFFNQECFNLQDRQSLKQKLESRELSVSKLHEYALNYAK